MKQPEIKEISVRDIVVNTGQIEGLPANPRKIDNAHMEKLKQSLRDNPEMLALRELLVYPYRNQYVLIGGNMRFQAMKSLGYKKAWCKVIPEEDTPPIAKLKAYIIKDNAAFGEWDTEMLHADWDEAELLDWGIDELVLKEFDEIRKQEEEEAEEDDYSEEDEKEAPAFSKQGDIWLLGRHRLQCGDSTNEEDIARLMDGQQADLLLTDPPYGVSYTANDTRKMIENDALEGAAFDEFLGKAFLAAQKCMRAGAGYYIWHADAKSFHFHNGVFYAGLQPVRQVIIWVKNTFTLGRQDYQRRHESCLYGWKTGDAHYFIPKRNIDTCYEQPVVFDKMGKKELARLIQDMVNEEETPQDIIHMDKPARSEEHPTMKPVKLFGWQITNSTMKGWRVLDIFGGSGTTIIACEQLGRTGYVNEFDPHYVDVIRDRYIKLVNSSDEVYLIRDGKKIAYADIKELNE